MLQYSRVTIKQEEDGSVSPPGDGYDGAYEKSRIASSSLYHSSINHINHARTPSTHRRRRSTSSNTSDFSDAPPPYDANSRCPLPPIRQLFPEHFMSIGDSARNPQSGPPLHMMSPPSTNVDEHMANLDLHYAQGQPRRSSFITQSPGQQHQGYEEQSALATPSSRPIVCDGCGKRFVNKADYIRHWRKSCPQNSNKTPRFSCPNGVVGCQETFARMDAVSAHLRKGRCKFAQG